MRFTADHVIEGLPLAKYKELYFEDEFNVALCRAVRLARRSLKFERTGDKVVRHVHVEPEGREIPAPVAKLLGQRRFSYVEELEMDLATGEGRWRTIPTLLPEKVDARGTLRFVDAGGSARRIVHGTIDVHVFGIGSIVERFICSDAERSYADAAVFTRAFIRERGLL